MKPALFALAALAWPLGAFADADRLCAAAQEAVARLAAAKGWQAEVRCRAAAGAPLAAGTVLHALDLPSGVALRSGPTTWAVRVQTPHAAAYVQRVPLTVAWQAPAWVARRELAAGALLQAEDFELQTLRWPDGLPVNAASAESPPGGRLRRAVRAGELLSAAQLLPAGALVRGDHVTAVLSEGAMEIRMPAQLLASARVGERARVQVQGRPVALEGRLADAQTLKVDSE